MFPRRWGFRLFPHLLSAPAATIRPLVYVPGGTMRHTTVLLIAAALALAGCSSGDDTPDAKPSPSPTYKLLPRDQFLQAVNEAGFESWADTAPPGPELLKFPEQWCTELEAGHSVEWLLGDGGLYPIGNDWGTEKSEAQELVVLGVGAYCPKLRGQVVEELRASGAY